MRSSTLIIGISLLSSIQSIILILALCVIKYQIIQIREIENINGKIDYGSIMSERYRAPAIEKPEKRKCSKAKPSLHNNKNGILREYIYYYE